MVEARFAKSLSYTAAVVQRGSMALPVMPRLLENYAVTANIGNIRV
jgi:hypothetical protein